MASPLSDPSTSAKPPLPPVKLDPVAALLSFLIPGLGQVYQGRVGKGILFFLGLYVLFFYGMWMGQWRNVWIPEPTGLPPIVIIGQQFDGITKALYYRPQFLGQVWIGIAAWPAIYQYIEFDGLKDTGPIFGKFERSPPEDELNDLQRNGSKRWDLGWVYTVIAGVLNLLVIYDAYAGPMFRDPALATGEEDENSKPVTPPVPVATAKPTTTAAIAPSPDINSQGGTP